MDFEELFREHRADVERFVKFRLPSAADAEDVLQESFFAAFLQFPSLKRKENFKAWVLGIARNKCNDYFRKRAKLWEIPIDDVSESRLCYGGCGISETHVAVETLNKLNAKEKQILYLYFWEELPQADIAAKLKIPLGTVKSRLHTAKQRFREHYPYERDSSKGELNMKNMKNLPLMLPDYTIKSVPLPPFAVRHEELPGMLVIPRVGEKLSFGMYDLPERRQSGVYRLSVTGRVAVHGICGVEIASEYTGSDGSKEESVVFAQLTDSHCRYLGGMQVDKDGLRNIVTFLDGDGFSDAYAIGEDNCGFEVERCPKGIIKACDNGLTTDKKDDVSDIVGRYQVTISGKTYDTVRLVDLQLSKDSYMMCEYYLDKNGRTVLWRRFNREDWAMERYGRKWTEALPDNERMTVNGEIYVHWYDCITDFFHETF